MVKIKKISLVLLSMLFCVTMYGCGTGEKSEQKNNQEAVAAEFAKAIDKFNATTYEQWEYTVDASDPSMWYYTYKNDFGDKLKSVKYEGDYVYEVKKDSTGKATDYKYLKYLKKKTMSFSDNSADKVENTYRLDDGYIYTNKDNEKSKYKNEYYFTSFAYKTLTADSVENVTLKTEGSKQIFNFEFRKDLRLTSDYDTFVRKDSDIELTAFKGTLIIDNSKNLIEYEEIEEFKDKKTGATLKQTEISKRSNNVPELEFPKDLNTYKEEA